MFKSVRATKRWVIGSLVSDTGSEYLFGYDPNQGLMWLERPGHEYSAADGVWGEAEQFIAARLSTYDPVAAPVPEITEVPEEERPKAVTRSAAQPQTVQRSEDGWQDPFPMEGDPRIVGDMSSSGRDVPDEDIAAQAAQFLMEFGEEE